MKSLHHCHNDLYHIIKRPFKVNSNHCSLILVELSLCALTTLLVYLLFELRLVVCRLWSTTVRFPFTSLKLPPRIVTFEHPAKKDPMIRNFKTEWSVQVRGRMWFKDKGHCRLMKGQLHPRYSPDSDRRWQGGMRSASYSHCHIHTPGRTIGNEAMA